MWCDYDFDLWMPAFSGNDNIRYVLDNMTAGIEEIRQYGDTGCAVIDTVLNAFGNGRARQFEESGMHDFVIIATGFSQLFCKLGDFVIRLLSAAAMSNQK
jgi:hypothetical protein